MTPWRRFGRNINMHYKRVDKGERIELTLLRIGSSGVCHEYCDDPSDSIKCMGYLNEYYLLNYSVFSM